MYRRRFHQNFLVHVFTIVFIYSSLTVAVEWEACLKKVLQEISNNDQYDKNYDLFRKSSTPTEPILTPKGCEMLCGGAGRHMYKDWGSIINTWILPTLVSSLEGADSVNIVLLTQKAAMSGHGWWDTIHIMANPIAWFKGVLDMIEVARTCVQWAAVELNGGKPLPERRKWWNPKRWWNGILRWTKRERRRTPKYGGLSTDDQRFSEQQQAGNPKRNWNVTRWWHKLMVKTRWEYIETPDFKKKMALATYLQALKTFKDINLNDAKALHGILKNHWVDELEFREFQYEIANSIALTRTAHSRLLLSLIALGLYGWQAISAFIVTIGGEWTTVPGGRIALAMFWHFIVAAILLSNTVGSFPSKEFCNTVVKKALERKKISLENVLEELDRKNKVSNRIPEDFEADRAERASLGDVEGRRDSGNSASGAIHLEPLRTAGPPPSTTVPVDPPKKPHLKRIFYWIFSRRLIILILAAIPVASSSADSLALLYYLPPEGPNCRFFLLIAISGTYVANALLTPLAQPLLRRNPIPFLSQPVDALLHYRQEIDRCKDLVIATVSTVFIIISACGFYNTCGCWSGQWSRNSSEAGLHLNSPASFDGLLKKRFPILFSVCVATQLFSFEAMRVFGQKGVAALRWSSVVDEDGNTDVDGVAFYDAHSTFEQPS
ncbi:hypothetical protein P154DRAFT_590902 [Amniculicola lignicola CBS 123094]|uniref:Integral membrane protein n=1 Tax=Amniculicola lignicola CBS 123094 TaxID=1392246 RepID=A0A6A5VWW2_9PLEO|nr:hypothetical protein P154DRAFT_590902 [Amniculicola lignicola CBS 123094]